jgi:hypothetical protein
MNKINKIKTITGIIVGLILGLLTLFDITSVKNNPTDYLNVYQISENANHWMFRSVSSYVKWDIMKICVYLAYIVLSIIAIIRKPKVLVSAILIFEMLVLIWVIRYFYLFYASGFDHYPSFDPYIF